MRCRVRGGQPNDVRYAALGGRLALVFCAHAPGDAPHLRRRSPKVAPLSYLAMTLRLGMPDSERPKFQVSCRELVQQAAVAGLRSSYVGRPTRDSLHRGDVQCVKVVLSPARSGDRYFPSDVM